MTWVVVCYFWAKEKTFEGGSFHIDREARTIELYDNQFSMTGPPIETIAILPVEHCTVSRKKGLPR